MKGLEGVSSAGGLGDRLGAGRHRVLGELTWELKAHGGLDRLGRDGLLLAVLAEAASLARKALEQVLGERVADCHGLLRDLEVALQALQDAGDVRAVGAGALPAAATLRGLLGLLLDWLLRHFGEGGCGDAEVQKEQ